VIVYDWEGQRCGYRLPPEAFLTWSPHLATYMVQGFLWKAAIAQLYASGSQSGAVTYSPTALDRALNAGMHRRLSRRR